MNTLIAGATGNTGARIVRKLNDGGHTPIAMHRASSDTSVLPEDTQLREADLTNLPDDVCADADVVVFAAGSGGDTDEEMTRKVDRDGAKRLIDLAAGKGVRRFVMLSSVGAGDPDPDSDLAHYLEAKHDADEHLKRSGLEYTIVRPVALTDEGETGNVRLGDDVDPQGKAARGDVAAIMARAVGDDLMARKVFLLETVYD
ncbi:MAG: oxidoreductase [Sphingomonadales bacterium CG12_big_fil_rev_8_21_14_0_65_65_10]|nr:MAG: oxidoreductase [Sphingomonadales bacterium CG12_big_fil_rev_8_21_14_0_65_65_10]